MTQPILPLRVNLIRADAAPQAGRRPLRRTSNLRSLEQRFMFDGAVVDAVRHAVADAATASAAVPTAVEVRAADPARDTGRKEVAIVDTSLAGYKTLEAGLRDGIGIVEFDGTRDGLEQIAQWAASQTGLDAIHILSHGAAGLVELGSTRLTAASVTDSVIQSELAGLGQALAPDGDLLLYGCDVAAGANGAALLDGLAHATGADVAASVDATGAAGRGGNWTLEAHVGKIDRAGLDVDRYQGLLGTLSFDGNEPDMYTDLVTKTDSDSGLTFTFTTPSNDSVYWDRGIGAGLGVLTMNAPAGHSFDLTGLKSLVYGGGSFTMTWTNADTSTGSHTYTADDNFIAVAGFTGLTGVTKVVFTFDVNIPGAIGDFVVANVASLAPTVTDGHIAITSTGSGTSGRYKIGDTVTALWDNSSSGDNQAGITGVTMNFTPFGGGAAVTATDLGSGHWSASYTITAGSIDASNRNVSVTASTGTGSSTTADTSNLSVDNQAPSVTDANLSLSGASGTAGAFKIGDTVTATWNNTAGGDNNADTIASASVDFSQFGGGTNVAATNSSGVWTASYTIVSGLIDGSNKNVSFSATDNAGNITTTGDTSNVKVDNFAPVVSDASISLSGASGTAGAFKIGDTVTATWNNTAGGDNNADTISGVTMDFSQFGGSSAVTATNSAGTWTATYTIVAGVINGTANRNVSVTATDNAGNTRTAADTTNATVDNATPGLSFSNLALSDDSGANDADFVTNVAAQTITATLSAALGGGDRVYGSLDNGASWVDLTGNVTGTAVSFDTAIAGSSTLKLKVTDAAGNDGAVTSQAYVLDTTAPGASSTPDMTSGTDTGVSSTDNLTRQQQPTFTGTAEAGSTVSVFDGASILGTTVATVGAWSFTPVGSLSAASHTIKTQVTDVAGNVSVYSSALTIEIDTAAPSSIGLSATTIVAADATSASAIATLSATDGNAISYSLAVGNGTNDADNGSFAISGTSLEVGSSSLASGTYKIRVAATDAAGNVAEQDFTVTVVDPPSIASITRAGGASATVATAADTLQYTVTFSEAVTGVDASDFALTATGTAAGTIGTVTGSGTTYTVTVGAISGDGSLRLDLNGSGTGIQNGGSVDIAGGYTAGQTYLLDHTAPAAPGTPDLAAGSDSGASSSDDITSDTTPTFSGTAEAGSTVTIYDGATLLDTVVATAGNWSYTASTLTDGDHAISVDATDAAGNVSAASAALAVTIDATQPTIASVAVPSAGSYGVGATIDVTVHTSDSVVVDTAGGTPYVALNIGGSPALAVYDAASSSGTALVFKYTVRDGDGDADGIQVTSLGLNGATARDAAGNTLSNILNNVGDSSGVLVDTITPTVDSVSVPADGTYYPGQDLDFTVNFSEAVVVDSSGGTPRIALTLDTGGTVYADYVSGSGSGALTFRHTVAAGEIDHTGITVGALGLNGGSIRDNASNTATLTLNSVGSTAAVEVEGGAPRVTGVTSPTADGIYGPGTTITIEVSLDRAVTVDTSGGVPTLALSSGGTAVYSSGSGSTTLSFTYEVGSGENAADLDSGSSGALLLAGATITDANGVHADADLTLPSSAGATLASTKDLVIDTTAPTNTASTVGFSSDTGSSTTDLVTSTAAQTVSGTLAEALAAGDTVQLSFDNGATWSTASAGTGATSFSLSVTLGGSDTLQVAVVDAAGNRGPLLTHAYAIDTQAPGVPTVDQLSTASPTPVLSGSAVLDAGGTLDVSVGGATYRVTPAGGHWTLDLAHATPASGTLTLVPGPAYDVAAKITDAAGNSSSDATFGELFIGDVPSTRVTGAQLSTDSGASASDFITNAAGQNVSGTLSGPLAADETVQISLDGGATWQRAAAAAGASTWNAQVTLSGSGTLAARVVNAVSDGPAYTHSYVLDTTAPAAPTVDPLTATGPAAVLSGSAPLDADATLTVSVGGASYAVTAVGGHWTLDLASAVPASGQLVLAPGQSYDVAATATDAAGNRASGQGTLVLRGAPSTVVISAALGSDTGTSGADFITQTAEQTVSGALSAALAAGETVEVSVDGGATWVRASAATGSASWSASVTLASGGTLAVRVANEAGGSPAFTHAYVVDSVAPAASAAGVTLDGGTLTGTLSGTLADGELVLVSTDNGGSWRTAALNPDRSGWTLANGASGTVQVKLSDTAGNDTAAQSFTVAAPPPVEPPPPVVAPPPVVQAPPVLTPAPVFTPAAPSAVTAPGAVERPFGASASSWAAPQADAAAGPGWTAAPLPGSVDSAVAPLVTTAPSTLTTPLTAGAFQAMVLPAAAGGGDRLIANRPLPDVSVDSGGQVNVQIGAEAFAHSSAQANVTLSAMRADGAPLPAWLRFDPRTGKFSGNPPPGFHGTLTVRVIARDPQGHEAVQVFKIAVGRDGKPLTLLHPQPGPAEAAGRTSLSQQLHDARGAAAGRLAALSHSAAVAAGRA